MGRTRSGREGARRGDAPAVSAQATARPHRASREPRCSAWRGSGGASSSPARARAVANAMAAPEFSHKWETLRPPSGDCRGIRLAELPDPPRRRRRSRSHCARRWRRPARRLRWSLPIASSRSACRRCSRGGASRPTTAPAGRSRQTPAGTLAARHRRCRSRGAGAGAAARSAQASARRRGGRGTRRVARCGARARSQAARPPPASRACRARHAFR